MGRHHAPKPLVSLKGYLTVSSFLSHIFFRFFVIWCSTNTSLTCSFMNLWMYLGSHNSLATPRSLQHRIIALDLQPSAAVGIPSGLKYSCSPRATETSLIGRYLVFEPLHSVCLAKGVLTFQGPPARIL